jgi:hypothetical protein
MKNNIFSLTVFMLFLSGTAFGIPLSEGWYLYDSARTYKDIETEFTMSQSARMKVVMETTQHYTGVVCRYEDGVLFDPLANMELSIDREGRISCSRNISIKGSLDNNGRFFWSGMDTANGRQLSLFVKGTLTALPARGGREFDGVYHMEDTGTGREQLVNISNGFYTWNYLDEEEAGEKTFDVRETALAMAEAAAAADLAEQLWVRVESAIMEKTDNDKTMVDERIKSETVQRLRYTVLEKFYNDKTNTAFVLAEMKEEP